MTERTGQPERCLNCGHHWCHNRRGPHFIYETVGDITCAVDSCPCSEEDKLIAALQQLAEIGKLAVEKREAEMKMDASVNRDFRIYRIYRDAWYDKRGECLRMVDAYIAAQAASGKGEE